MEHGCIVCVLFVFPLCQRAPSSEKIRQRRELTKEIQTVESNLMQTHDVAGGSHFIHIHITVWQ